MPLEVNEPQQPSPNEETPQLMKPVAHPPQPKCNNNHRIVPLGVIVVIATLYLSGLTMQQTFSHYTTAKAQPLPDQQQQYEPDELLPSRTFKDYDDVCEDIEVFTGIGDEIQTAACDVPEVKEAAPIPKTKTRPKSQGTRRRLSRRNGNGAGKREKPGKFKNGKRNGGHKAPAKDADKTKKSSTAEPIIYLFALVLIYLLLKAASDINQHYKSEAKGDKRLRRCSLQSYAQTHKQDRRASKGIAGKNLSKLLGK